MWRPRHLPGFPYLTKFHLFLEEFAYSFLLIYFSPVLGLHEHSLVAVLRLCTVLQSIGSRHHGLPKLQWVGLVARHHMGSSWIRKRTHVPWIGMQILNPRTNMEVPSNFWINCKCTTFCPTHSGSLVYESVFIDMLKIRTKKEHVRC